MKPVFACLTILLFWACIYLPGLGTREIRGEEWRRTLPARTMLNTGEWVVPYSGGVPYLHKPPLINWVNAASFTLTGVQNEWSARLPGALLMLGGALGIYAFSRRAMGGDAAFVGTVFFLTSVGCIEKGRLAEIEVYYIALTGLAFSAWLAGFMGKMNRWASWLSAGLLLGLAFLAKGPVHLLFFYFIVLGACWKTRRWRELLSLPHLAAVILFLGIFLAWAIPFVQQYGRLIESQPWLAPGSMKGAAETAQPEAPMGALATWRHELASRVTGEEESSTKDWLVRGPRALTMFLPWILFIPLWWKRDALKATFGEGETLNTYRGICWGAVAGFAVLVLLPSSSPRYVAPLLGPAAVMIGWFISLQNLRAASVNGPWRIIAKASIALGAVIYAGATAVTFVPPEPVPPSGWQLSILVAAFVAGLVGVFRLKALEASHAAVRSCFFTLAACAFLMFGYCWLGMWSNAKNEDIRPTALAIRDAMEPKDAPLVAFHLGQEPYAFYLPPDTRELYDIEQLPDSGIRWMLTTTKVDTDFRPYFEKRFGSATKIGEWTGAWGASDQDVNRHMVLLRFAGK
jgi:4-amino-4-deoxy-L-arabinose transferase-like glycosyltransferase